jgi:hypothetical protein
MKKDKMPSREEFINRWTEPNEKQADGRLDRFSQRKVIQVIAFAERDFILDHKSFNMSYGPSVRMLEYYIQDLINDVKVLKIEIKRFER